MKPPLDRLLGILETSGPPLHAMLTRLTLRADAAEDLLQELFLKLRRSEGLWRAKDPTAYVFRAAMHLAFDWRRKRKRDAEPLRADPAVLQEPPLQRLIDAEDYDRILDAVRRLPRLCRTALVLRYLQQQDYADIARQLDRTEHQARALCHKAVSRLRTSLRPIEDLADGKGRPA